MRWKNDPLYVLWAVFGIVVLIAAFGALAIPIVIVLIVAYVIDANKTA